MWSLVTIVDRQFNHAQTALDELISTLRHDNKTEIAVDVEKVMNKLDSLHHDYVDTQLDDFIEAVSSRLFID